MTTEERILKAAAEGVSIRAIAAEHGLSEEEVVAVLDRAAELWFTGGHLRRELLLEVERLKPSTCGAERKFFCWPLVDESV